MRAKLWAEVLLEMERKYLRRSYHSRTQKQSMNVVLLSHVELHTNAVLFRMKDGRTYLFCLLSLFFS